MEAAHKLHQELTRPHEDLRGIHEPLPQKIIQPAKRRTKNEYVCSTNITVYTSINTQILLATERS